MISCWHALIGISLIEWKSRNDIYSPKKSRFNMPYVKRVFVFPSTNHFQSFQINNKTRFDEKKKGLYIFNRDIFTI